MSNTCLYIYIVISSQQYIYILYSSLKDIVFVTVIMIIVLLNKNTSEKNIKFTVKYILLWRIWSMLQNGCIDQKTVDVCCVAGWSEQGIFVRILQFTFHYIRPQKYTLIFILTTVPVRNQYSTM